MEKYVLLLLYANTLQGLELCSTTAFDDKDQKICAYSEGYDQYVNPDFPKPTQVQIDIVVRSVLSVDENSQLLELVAYSNLRWFDPRLDLNDGTIQRIRPSKAEYGDLWKTSIHYSNVVTNTNRGNKPYAYKNSSNSGLTTGLWIEKVLLNKAVISCRMDFSNFPFDSHICNWKIRAVDTMNVTILNIDSIQQETKNELTATVSQPIPVETTNLPYDIYVSPGAKGVEMVQREETSFILVKFLFARNKNGKLELISGYFIPTVLFAFLSLVSYLIKPEIVRLTISLFSNQVNQRCFCRCLEGWECW